MIKKKGNSDRKEISMQPWEIWWVWIRYRVPRWVTKQVIREHGNSRKRVYAILRENGWKTPLL